MAGLLDDLWIQFPTIGQSRRGDFLRLRAPNLGRYRPLDLQSSSLATINQELAS